MSHSSKCDQNHNFSKNEQATSGVLLKQESVNYFLQIFNSAAQQYKNKMRRLFVSTVCAQNTDILQFVR